MANRYFFENGIEYDAKATDVDGIATKVVCEVTYPNHTGEYHELSNTAWFMPQGDIGLDELPDEYFVDAQFMPCANLTELVKVVHLYNRPVMVTSHLAAYLIALYGGRLESYGRILDAADTYVWYPDTFDAVLVAGIDTPDRYANTAECGVCSGTGRTVHGRETMHCTPCNGSGHVPV